MQKSALAFAFWLRNAPRISLGNFKMRISRSVAPGARVAAGHSMKLPRRTLLHLASNLTLGVAALMVVSQAAWAQAYPSRPITIVVPFTAGGPTDALVRTLSE